MSRTTARVSLLGLFLVLLGALLLLRKAGVIDIGVHDIIWPALSLFGVIIAGRGLADGRRGKIVGGTVLFLYSIFFLVRSFNRYELPFEMLVPSTFLIFGVVFVMLFVNRPADWYFLVPGLLLLLAGAAFLLTEYGNWYGWEVRDALATWWPLALVLMGLGMLFRRRSAGGQGPANTAGSTGAAGSAGGIGTMGGGSPDAPPPGTGAAA